ncbi:hypothetical protein MTO96_008315 [Rhipicephalus appendiculatus]
MNGARSRPARFARSAVTGPEAAALFLLLSFPASPILLFPRLACETDGRAAIFCLLVINIPGTFLHLDAVAAEEARDEMKPPQIPSRYYWQDSLPCLLRSTLQHCREAHREGLCVRAPRSSTSSRHSFTALGQFLCSRRHVGRAALVRVDILALLGRAMPPDLRRLAHGPGNIGVYTLHGERLRDYSLRRSRNHVDRRFAP